MNLAEMNQILDELDARIDKAVLLEWIDLSDLEGLYDCVIFHQTKGANPRYYWAAKHSKTIGNIWPLKHSSSEVLVNTWLSLEGAKGNFKRRMRKRLDNL